MGLVKTTALYLLADDRLRSDFLPVINLDEFRAAYALLRVRGVTSCWVIVSFYELGLFEGRACLPLR